MRSPSIISQNIIQMLPTKTESFVNETEVLNIRLRIIYHIINIFLINYLNTVIASLGIDFKYISLRSEIINLITVLTPYFT